MNSLTLLDIPESDVDRTAWLEQQLVGTQLGALVQQLRYVRQELGDATSTSNDISNLELLLGNDRDAVLRHGLSVLDIRRLHVLLQQPNLLLELQELVLIHGGAYWNELLDQRSSNSEAPRTVIPASRTSIATSSSSSPSGRRTWLWTSLAAAATVLIAIGVALNRSGEDAASGWGFSTPDLLASNGTSAQYLDALAAAANQWFDKPTLDANSLQKRLGEFSQGCAKLIAAKHEPLNDAQRTWLVDKCREWKSKIDLLQTQLASGKVSMLEGSSHAKEIVERMVLALQTEAQKA